MNIDKISEESTILIVFKALLSLLSKWGTTYTLSTGLIKSQSFRAVFYFSPFPSAVSAQVYSQRYDVYVDIRFDLECFAYCSIYLCFTTKFNQNHLLVKTKSTTHNGK